MERVPQPVRGPDRRGLIVLFLILASLGALVVFSLALAQVLAGWGIFFFYTVPALAMLAWAWREVSPSTWRRAVWPFLRVRRRVARRGRDREAQRAVGAVSRPTRPGEAGLIAPVQSILPTEPVAVIVEGTIRPWLAVMRAFLAAWRSRRGRVVVTAGFGVAAVGTFALVARHFASIGWPLGDVDLGQVAVAASLFLLAYPLKAFGCSGSSARTSGRSRSRSRPPSVLRTGARRPEPPTGATEGPVWPSRDRPGYWRRLSGCSGGTPTKTRLQPVRSGVRPRQLRPRDRRLRAGTSCRSRTLSGGQRGRQRGRATTSSPRPTRTARHGSKRVHAG